MEKCMKSTIDGAHVKNKILSAVKKAIKECASQHDSNIQFIEEKVWNGVFGGFDGLNRLEKALLKQPREVEKD